MTRPVSPGRRALLRRLALGVSLAPAAMAALRPALAAAPLLSPDSNEARAVHYVEDATAAKASGGNSCATCGLYQGASGAAQGPCQLFAGKDVRAAGWCSSWVGQM